MTSTKSLFGMTSCLLDTFQSINAPGKVTALQGTLDRHCLADVKLFHLFQARVRFGGRRITWVLVATL